MERKFHDIQQDDDWLKIRLGYITSSNFACIMANNPKNFGEPAKKYAMKLAVESVTGNKIETYTNKYMEDGINKEQDGRELYEEETMQAVKNGGFMTYGEYASSSDGLVLEDGMVEIKSVIFSTQFANISRGLDPAYKWQIQGQLFVYDRKWVDFTSYCDVFPEGKQLNIVRIYRDEEMISSLESRLLEFNELVKNYKEILK